MQIKIEIDLIDNNVRYRQQCTKDVDADSSEKIATAAQVLIAQIYSILKTNEPPAVHEEPYSVDA
ncbi:hypothetical protein DYU11_01610 [Fibrisoma montanum]|uniref:Uncharacterized protein n=1 Tax=Fibrisoma montanum TaxID=2305895 RepID=A0A418MHY9_9BACT|nr:hypothetical protein [Fibrisoma montanum]RIV27040.1 hypothetical protein DYU11_01610 [Fibrisoma montanum]